MELKLLSEQRNSAIIVTQETIDEDVMIDAEEMIPEVTNVEEEMIVKEEIAETIVTIVRIMTGFVLNVKIQTLHSEPNVIDVEKRKVAATLDSNVAIDEDVMIDADEMIGEEVTVVDVIVGVIEATEEEIKVLTPTMIGNVENVKIQTSHSEPNVIDVVHLKEEEAHLPEPGKAMIEGQAIEERLLNQGRETGIALNVENLILLNEMNALVVAAQKE